MKPAPKPVERKSAEVIDINKLLWARRVRRAVRLWQFENKVRA